MINGKKTAAVTLMELLVVVAILGIIGTLAFSGYTRVKMETRRDDAHASLIATEAIIERYLSENNKDNLDSGDLALAQFANYSSASSTPVFSNQGYYRITIDTDTTGYTISATATHGNSLTSCDTAANTILGQCPDTACRVIYIEYGAHKSKNSSGTVSDASTTTCW